MSSNFNCSYMARNSLTYILGFSVKFFFRMRSSSLNEHLYIKNIIDNPNCLCGEIESTSHYLFKCPKYTRQQNILFENYFSY